MYIAPFSDHSFITNSPIDQFGFKNVAARHTGGL